jgi:tetratricopeptide (TPR) repeat protein
VTSRLLTEAIGYIELGMFQDAWDTLETIPPEQRDLADVLKVRLEIYRGLGKYDGMEAVASHLCRILPDDCQNWISSAYAQRRHLGIEIAEKTLLEAVKRFPEEPTIHFNLACYACQQGRLDEARERLSEAIRLEPRFKQMALEDEDLSPLW